MAENAAQKTIYGHLTMYNKSVVFSPGMIAMEENVYCRQYLGGNGVRVADPLNPSHTSAYHSGTIPFDAFVTLTPLNAVNRHERWRCITGSDLPTSLSAAPEVAETMAYPGAAGFAQFWQMQCSGRTYLSSQYRCAADVSDRKLNVICRQMMIMKYNPQTKANDRATLDAGHWGPQVYPGCGQVRNGRGFHLLPPTYMPTKTTSLA